MSRLARARDEHVAAAPEVTSGSPWLRWPLPALASWACAWGLHELLSAAGVPTLLAPLSGSALGLALSPLGTTRMRRLLIAGGFPLSWLASGAAGGLPAWAWLLPALVLALAYPAGTWRDAPLFPTPRGALDGLASLAPLPKHARIVDAGCGLGHGLRALRRAYPNAQLRGIEWSWPLALATRLRCRWAEVRRGDMWRDDWAGADLVYLFQRPESMARAVDKARRELNPGAWLASLEFDASDLRPQAVLQTASGKPVWLYRVPFVERDTLDVPGRHLK